MKKSIALIYGGNSEEAGVSIQSGRNVAEYISREDYIRLAFKRRNNAYL